MALRVRERYHNPSMTLDYIDGRPSTQGVFVETDEVLRGLTDGTIDRLTNDRPGAFERCAEEAAGEMPTAWLMAQRGQTATGKRGRGTDHGPRS